MDEDYVVTYRPTAVALETLLLGPTVQQPVYVCGLVRGAEWGRVPDRVPLAVPAYQLLQRRCDGVAQPSGLVALPYTLTRPSAAIVDVGAYLSSLSAQARLEPTNDGKGV